MRSTSGFMTSIADNMSKQLEELIRLKVAAQGHVVEFATGSPAKTRS
jgi:hypothetical protein